MQNIGEGNAGDAFYRYKMPKLQAKIEGRGNGIKTNIVNNVDIARSLERPPTYTLKYFGCDLGAQTKFDKDTGMSIVNGAHDAKKLSEILEGFIKKYVQCYSCGNPETVIKIRKECIHLKCKACGNMSDVDMRDKLTTFIIKNPPENKLSKAEAKVKKETKERLKDAEKEARKSTKVEKDKDGKKKRKDSSKAKSSTKGSDEDDGGVDDDVECGEDDADEDDGTVWKTDMSEEAVKKRTMQQLTAATAALVQQHLKVDEDPAAEADASGAAVSGNGAAPARDGAHAAADGDGDDDESESEDDEDDEITPVELLREHIDSQSAAYVAAVLNKSKVAGGAVGRMKLFYEALLGECEGKYFDRMREKENHIAALAQDPASQASQLIALEHFMTQVAKPERLVEVPFILKMLFEEDLIDDSIIVMWGETPAVGRKHGVDAKAAKEIRAIAQPVIEWLQEDDDDEDDDDEDEESEDDE